MISRKEITNCLHWSPQWCKLYRKKKYYLVRIMPSKVLQLLSFAHLFFFLEDQISISWTSVVAFGLQNKIIQRKKGEGAIQRSNVNTKYRKDVACKACFYPRHQPKLLHNSQTITRYYKISKSFPSLHQFHEFWKHFHNCRTSPLGFYTAGTIPRLPITSKQALRYGRNQLMPYKMLDFRLPVQAICTFDVLASAVSFPVWWQWEIHVMP